MRVLVTGGTGFVGANLVHRLVRDGHDVHLLVRPEADFWRIREIQQDLHLHQVNLTDREGVGRAVALSQPEWVFHLAVYGAYSFQTDLTQILQSDILGTANLLEACEQTGFAAFINTGSSSEYGFKHYPPAELEYLEPNSHYAVAKASATLLCSYTSRRLRLPISTLRLYSVYGPYEDARRLIPRLIRYGLEGTYPPLASPEIARDFVYVNDVVDAYLKAIACPSPGLGEVYNIGSGVQTRLNEVVEIVRRLVAIPQAPVWNGMERRIWDTEVWVANSAKAQKTLNWTATYGITDGLLTTIDWMREHINYYPL
jgi:nucleoside-diphosphate-sugar epimerase